MHILENFLTFFEPFIDQLSDKLELSYSLVFDAFFIILAGLWLTCAFWAASMAARMQSSKIIHFAISLLIPVLYAVVLSILLPGILRRQRREARKLQKAAEAEKRQRKIPPPETKHRSPGRRNGSSSAPGEKPQTESESTAASAENDRHTDDKISKEHLYYDFFYDLNKLQKNNQMVRPLRISYAGVEIVANCIIEVMPQLVVVETATKDRYAKPQCLRIPFRKIESIKQQDENGNLSEVHLAADENAVEQSAQNSPK